MCKYCNYNIPLHYLLNNAPLLNEVDATATSAPETIGTNSNLLIPEQDNIRDFVVEETAAIPNITIDDVRTIDSSVGRELIFTVKLDTPSNQTVSVDYTTVDNTAVAEEDYLPVNGTVTFAPGKTQTTIAVNTTGTSYLDPDEDFAINLTNAKNAAIDDSYGQGTILPAYAGIKGSSRQEDLITFSFFSEDVFGQGGYDGSDRESNAREPSEAIKANYRQIFEHLNTFVDREFVEVEESKSRQGDIRIVVSDGPSYAYAGKHIHLAGWAAASDAGINGWESDRGVYAYSALMHELGHAIGMPHSFGKDTSVFDPEENASNTVMSYTYPGSSPATFMSYDIKSLQERYGAAEYRPEDTLYKFLTVDNYVVDGEIAIDTTKRLKQTIWDSGGIDTFDFSGLAIDDSGYRFDLNQSKYQTTQDAYEGAFYERNRALYYVPDYGTSIAIDVEIENLINSSSDDIIIANPAANTFSGYGLGLTTGDDILIGTDSLDTLDLSEFSFLDIAKTPLETDLKFELGRGNSITIRDYYRSEPDNRINIISDDREVFIDDNYRIIEGDDGVNLANFTVNLSQPSNEPVEINYATADATAKAGIDYVANTGKVVFEPGETSKTIAIEILGDTRVEATEHFRLDLLGNYGQAIDRVIGSIDDDDGTVSLPTVSVSDTTVTYGNNNSKALFTVVLDRSSSKPVTVDYTTEDNTAVAGQDYTVASGTLTFVPGERKKTVEVDLIGDRSSSRDEDFQLLLSNISSNATIYDSEGIGTILDSTLNIGLTDGTETNLPLASYPADSEKDPNNLEFELADNHRSLTIKGDGNGWKEIPLGEYIGTESKPLSPYTVVEFDFKSTESGKLHGIHFEGKDHHDFYSPWEQGRFFQLYGSGEFGIQDFNDYKDSIGEWKTYQIPVHQYFDTTNYRRYGEWIVFAHEGNNKNSNTQFRNLQLKELLPISVAGVAVNESDGIASFTLSLPEASEEQITLDYATVDDTAVAGQDYTAASGTVTFKPGETTKTIDIAIDEDERSETEESFNLYLSNISKAIAIEPEISATIIDNDTPLPVISVGNISLNEGDTDTTAVVTFNLDKSWTKSVTVDYSTSNNTAVAGLDYQAASGTVTFKPGETTKTIEIGVNGDVVNEADESFYLQLDNPNGAEIAAVRAKVAINNDDALPSLKIEDAGVLSSIPIENNQGKIINSTGLLFKVILDAPSERTIKVDYATADDTAKADEDYTAKDKTLTFEPGETEKNIFIEVTLDEIAEADEQLYLDLSNAKNAIIADERAVGTIEETRSVSVSDVEVSEDSTEAVFTVSLDKPSVQGVFVNYATADDTAKAGTDYKETKGRLFIEAGETSATVAVPLIDNKLTEEDETFWLNLTKPKYVSIADEAGTATVLNDDAIPVASPGGIYRDLQLWLKADAEVTASEGKITTWSDNSQAGIDLSQDISDRRPTLQNNALNHNSVVSFDGSNDTLIGIDTLPEGFATDDASIFIVSQSDRASQRSTILAVTPDDTYQRLLVHLPYKGKTYFDRGNIHNRGRLSTSFDVPNTFQLWNFQTETGVGQSIFRNGTYTATDTDTSESFKSLGKTLELSSLISPDAFEGDIAEVIIFNRALDLNDRNSVDSYLSIKYGLTLDQTTPSNYITSDGSIIWDAATAGDYQHDIAGITTDLGSGLRQVQSLSSNDDGMVTIGNASDLQNGEALFWSNNDGAIDLNNNSDYLNRQWQVQETGEVGEVSISFDLSQLGLDLPVESYAIQIDDDDSFNSSKFHTIGRTIDDNTLTFTEVDLEHGDYFTLNTAYSDRPTTQLIGEVGTITKLNHQKQKIELNNIYTNPVVFAMPLSYEGSAPAIARITDIQDDSFTIYAQEAEYDNGIHAKESLSYLVLEAGIWELTNGDLLEVGTIDTNSMTTSKWENIDFAEDFDLTPAILSQVQTDNGSQFVRTRQRSADVDGFQLTMEEEEALKFSGHRRETLGWLAIEPGSGGWNDLEYQAGHAGKINHTWDRVNFEQTFAVTPNLLASLASFAGSNSSGLRYRNLNTSQVQLKVEEDRSLDNEIRHGNEIVDFLAIAGTGDLTAVAYDADNII